MQQTTLVVTPLAVTIGVPTAPPLIAKLGRSDTPR